MRGQVWPFHWVRVSGSTGGVYLGVLGGNEAEITVCIWEKRLQQAEAALVPLQEGRGLQVVLSPL